MPASEALDAITKGTTIYVPTGGDKNKPTPIELRHQQFLEELQTLTAPVVFGLPKKVKELIMSGESVLGYRWLDGFYIPWTGHTPGLVHNSRIYFASWIGDEGPYIDVSALKDDIMSDATGKKVGELQMRIIRSQMQSVRMKWFSEEAPEYHDYINPLSSIHDKPFLPSTFVKRQLPQSVEFVGLDHIPALVFKRKTHPYGPTKSHRFRYAVSLDCFVGPNSTPFEHPTEHYKTRLGKIMRVLPGAEEQV